jgi:AMMECR1 domain-containing protein
LVDLGRAIAGAAAHLNRRIAIVASGDMSHRLAPNAPGGYHPRAHQFDDEFMACLRRGAYHELERFDPDLQELAGEDALDSTLVAVAAADWEATGHEVLSYEGPFGVGYGVAVLMDSEVDAGYCEQVAESAECLQAWAKTLPQVARESVRAALFETAERTPPIETGYLELRRGVFVTIRGPRDELRACVGTLTPHWRNVVDETRHAARDAAFRDWRFSPVRSEEFQGLRFEVSVIETLEEVASEAELDPTRYGVLVTTADGRQGCLLPGIPDIRTAPEQVQFARRKGRIGSGEPVRLQRFEAAKFEEGQLQIN